ncbi:MAG: MFS transporter, partial [Pseudomonadota bacterium]
MALTSNTSDGQSSGAEANVSPWAPFRHGAFTLLWSATLLSNIGTWMHDVGAGWLMTELDPSPATVTLVQAATMAPIFCFALLAGAVADRFDKRRILLRVNLFLCLIIALMTGLVSAGVMTPGLLVLFTFAIGSLTAFAAPAWQAVVPRLVPKPVLSEALALNSLGINLSRAIGPAIAGLLITAVGTAAPFGVNALSCLIAAVAIFCWRPQATAVSTLPPEPLVGSIATGLRHAANNRALKATLLRAMAFFLCASAFWSLLPLIARSFPGSDSRLYGLLLASVGIGAVGGALLLPGLRKRYGSNRLALAASGLLALVLLTLAVSPNRYAAIAASLAGGLAWITTMVN